MADKEEKDLTEVRSFDWVRVLFGNESCKITGRLFNELVLGSRSKIGVSISDSGGGGLLEPSVGIVFAYDSNDISKHLIYAYIRKNGEHANRIVLAANVISLGAQNSQGTSVIKDGDTQICLFIDK